MTTLTATEPSSTASETPDAFDAFDALDVHEKPATGRQPEPILALRRAGRERFQHLGFPTLRDEEWRFTNVGPIARARYQRAGDPPHSLSAADVEPWSFENTAARLVFVDGAYDEDLSFIGSLPAGTRLGSLAKALEEIPDLVVEHLGRHARFEEHAFVALNTAYFQDGAFLSLPAGAVVDGQIHLLFMSTGARGKNGELTAAFLRNLLIAGEASQATIVETYCGPEGIEYFNCPVTELVVGPAAVIDHYKMQQESTDAFHMATFQLRQERASNYSLHSISLGGGVVRNDVNTKLVDEGCESTLNGLYLVRGKQFVDHHMLVEHVAAHCNSYELFKGILEERSRAVFSGLIHVYEGAQKTDAKQSNQNLLLSDQALVNSNPQLRIFADDVKCTHGSTVGQLDDDAVFYLRSRGIGEEAARSLLTYAFASDIVERIKVPELRRDLEEFLFTRLPKGEVVRQAV